MARRRLTRAQSQARTRQELLAAAERVLARRGYERASIAEIAEEAGYSHGAVYSNFEGKQDLLLALYEHWVARRVAEIDATAIPGQDLAERVHANVEDWIAQLSTDPAPFLLRLELTLRAVHDPELRHELATRVGAVPLAIRRSVETDTGGQGDLPLPPDDLALVLQALTLGLGLEALADPDALPPDRAAELAAAVAQTLVRRPRSEERA